jgi:hypothetical protein
MDSLDTDARHCKWRSIGKSALWRQIFWPTACSKTIRLQKESQEASSKGVAVLVDHLRLKKYVVYGKCYEDKEITDETFFNVESHSMYRVAREANDYFG